MAKFKLNDQHKKFIKRNRWKMSGRDMAREIGCSASCVYAYMKKENLTVSRELTRSFARKKMIGRTSFTLEEDEMIRQNYLSMPLKRLASKIGRSDTGIRVRMRQLGLVIPQELRKKWALESRFQKGRESPNKGKKLEEYLSPEAIKKVKKTWFKKGHTPHNTLYNGFERITKDGYIEVRIKRGVFRLKHLHEWEKINGPLPEGYCLRCIDGNVQNTKPENWQLITRAENMRLNSITVLPPELRETVRLVNKLNESIINKLRNG